MAYWDESGDGFNSARSNASKGFSEIGATPRQTDAGYGVPTPRVDPAAQSMANWFERHRNAHKLAHIFKPLPVGSEVFFQQDVHCREPWQPARIVDHVHNKQSDSLHYKVLLKQKGMALVVEHFRVAPMVVRVALRELSSGEPDHLDNLKVPKVSDADVRWGGALPVAKHPDSQQITVLWLNHFGRESFNPFATLEYDFQSPNSSTRYERSQCFDACLQACPTRLGLGLSYFIGTTGANSLKDCNITEYNPVSDEYVIQVPSADNQVTSWPHTERAAFTAIARLPDRTEDCGVIAVSKSDEDVEVKTDNSLYSVPAKDARIQPWYLSRVTMRHNRMSHNCQIM
jgi:hypothetical protein